METTKFESLADDLLVQVFGFLPVGDILNGVWRLNKRSNQVLRHSSTRVWMLSFATTWDHQISSLDPKVDWFAAAVARMRLELSQLDPVEPFSSYVNKLIEHLVPLTDATSVGSKQKIASQLHAAARNRRWSAAVSGNMKELFDVHLHDRSQISNSVGADFVRENFVNRRRWYVVSSRELKSFHDVSSIHRILYAHFVVYSVRGQPLHFQYFHEWEDGDSGTGFDHPRYIELKFEDQGIFSTRSRAYNAATMLRAKCALLGLNPELQQDVEKASNVSNQITHFSGTHSSRPDPLWKYELNQPFSEAIDMIAGAKNKLRREVAEKDFKPPTDQMPSNSLFPASEMGEDVNYDDLLKYVTVKPLEKEPEKEEATFRWGRSVQQDELDSDEMPHPVALQLLPLHVKSWERARRTEFDDVLPTIRSQLIVNSHLDQWLNFASEIGYAEIKQWVDAEEVKKPLPITDNTGLELMKDLLQESEIVIVKTLKDMERDRGHGCRTARTEFSLRPKKGSKFQFEPTTLVFKFCVCRSTWGETFDPDMVKLSVFESSNYDVFSYSRKGATRQFGGGLFPGVGGAEKPAPKEPSVDEKLKEQAYRFLMLKKRLFNDQHAEISAQVLLGALVAIGMSADCWRRDGLQIYRYYDEEQSLRNILANIFRKAMEEAERASSVSASMDLESDAKQYAPITNAERAREKAAALAEENAKKLREEQEKLKRDELAKQSKAIRTDPLDFPIVSGGSFPFSSGKSVKQIPYAPHVFLACRGAFLVDTSSWPPTFQASDIDVVHPRLIHPTLSIGHHRVSRRVNAHSTSSQETMFVTNSLPFKLINMQSADALIAELNSAMGQQVSLNSSNKLPVRRSIGGRMLVGSRSKHSSDYPLVLETEPGAMKFKLIEGISDQFVSSSPFDPANHNNSFRNNCRLDRVRRLNVVRMPTKNFPAGFYQEAIFTVSDAYLIKEGTNESAKLQALEQDGVTPASVARSPREDTHFINLTDGTSNGGVRLFHIRSKELFEVIWDPANPLAFRYVQIFTNGLPGSIKAATSANGVGILVTQTHTFNHANFPQDETACLIIRVPAPLDSFDTDKMTAFSTGASFVTVTWPELGWADASQRQMLFWQDSEKSILVMGSAPVENVEAAPPSVPSDTDEDVIKTDFNCSKCYKWGMKGMAWIPKNRTSDGALCIACYEKLDTDTRIELSSDLELVDLDALAAKTVIPFVPPTGKTILTKLPFDEIASKPWTPMTPSSSAFPVRGFKPRSTHILQLKQSPVSTAICRAGIAVDPPGRPDELSIVAGWESGANQLPTSHLVEDWKRYESIRDLLADNLGAIVLVNRKRVKGVRTFGSFSSADDVSKASIWCFLDFCEKFSGEPQTIQLENAREGSYSSSVLRIDEIRWIGVMDYDTKALSNHGRESLVIDSSSFGF